MSRYTVEFTSAAAKQVRKLDPAIRWRLLSSISLLQDDPRPAGSKKLIGESDAWRIRVGDYRVIYEIADARLTVTVVRAAHRREVY
ncbi:MAG: type II toxin-antitoxin system RelE family toxin [Microbacteriaceae bacterium]